MRRTGSCVTILLALASVACIRPGGPGDLRRELVQTTGLDVRREFGITVGRSGLALARWGLRLAGEDEIPIRGVHKVQIGVYEVRGPVTDPETAGRLDPAELFGPGWETAVRVHEDGEHVFVLTHADAQERIRQMLVVVLEQDEWVLVRLKGNLDRTIEQAMRYALDEAGRPELFARVRRERDGAHAIESHDDDEPGERDVPASHPVCDIGATLDDAPTCEVDRGEDPGPEPVASAGVA